MFVVQQNWFRELAHELHVVVIVSQVPLFVCKQSRKTVKAFDGFKKSFKMSERPARIRHRMTELRDRLNAHINRILTEVEAEGSSVMDR